MLKMKKQSKAELKDTIVNYCEQQYVVDSLVEGIYQAVLDEKLSTYQEALVRDALKADDLGLVARNSELLKLLQALDINCASREEGVVYH